MEAGNILAGKKLQASDKVMTELQLVFPGWH